MNPRRFAIMGATLFGTVLLVGGIIAAVAGFGMADVKKTHTARIEDRATEKGEVSVSNADAMSAAAAMTAIAKAALPDVSPMSAPETPPVQIAAVSSSDLVHTDAKEAASSAETSMNHCLILSQTPLPETPPCRSRQRARLTWSMSDAKEAVNSTANLDESLPDLSQALAPHECQGDSESSNETRTNARSAKSASTNTCGRCTSGRPSKTPSRWSSEGT